MITRINSNNHMYHFWFRNISISKLWKDTDKNNRRK